MMAKRTHMKEKNINETTISILYRLMEDMTLLNIYLY